MTKCLACSAGLHGECLATPEQLAEHSDAALCCCDTLTIEFGASADTGAAVRERILKDDSEITDQTSTGRKRAAQLYPVTDGMVCEWAYLKFAGGGAFPLIGCEGTILYAAKGKHGIHHGPDKSTLNNEPGNVHRICPSCHNRWHALNDPYYPKDRPEAGQPHIPLSGEYAVHDPDTVADDEDFEYSEEYWKLPLKKRAMIAYREELP